MTQQLVNKVCLVTGASRGIGAAIAKRFAQEGARVALHYGSNRAAAENVLATLPGSGHAVFGADLSHAGSGTALVADVLQEFGCIDVLVNNAGIYAAHPPLDVSAADWLHSWHTVLEVNLVAPAVICQAVAKEMVKKGGGRIINIGSRGAFRGEPEGPAYGASKAALHAMSQSLAVALAPHNIQVCAVAPGFVATDMASDLLASEAGDAIRAQSPMNRVADPDEIAATVAFLATTTASFLSGGIIDINGASYLRS